MGYFAMQHSTQADYKALQINATPLQRIASQTRAIQIKHEAMWGEFLSLSLSLSLVSQFVIFFICKAKIHKFSVIANEPQGEVWQSIVKNGFYRLPRKNSLTLIFARNDGVAKIHKIHSKNSQLS